MAEESPKGVTPRRIVTVSSLVVAWVVSGLAAGYLIWTSAPGPLPFAALHDGVTTALGVSAVIAWLWHIAARSINQIREHAAEESNRVHAAVLAESLQASRRLNRIEALVSRSCDESTDRIVGVVAAAQSAVEARITVIEAAVSQHVCAGYTDGYADAASGRAPDGVRTRLRSVNGRRI